MVNQIPEVLPIKDFLERSQMSYEWIDISNDNLGRYLVTYSCFYL